MRIVYAYQGTERVFDRDTMQIVIGRQGVDRSPDLDLTPDRTVSRSHARLWIADEQYWIEDLDSRVGTRVNDESIKGRGPWQLHAGDTIAIGYTTLQVDIPTPQVDILTPQVAPDVSPQPDEALAEVAEVIGATMDATTPVSIAIDTMAEQTMRRLALLYELPLQFAAVTQLDVLLQTIVERLVGVIPGAERGALLLTERGTGQLLLKAHLPVGNPSVSLTLARRAVEHREGFVSQHEATDMSVSVLEYRIGSAMYAPLLWHGEALGVICVDHPESMRPFSRDDLQLLMAVAHYAAMAVAHQHLQEELQRESSLRANLLRQFPPQMAERLLHHQGRLRLASERCEVTVLFSDMRGFTSLAKDMDPDDVMEMLNAYFAHLIPVLFAHRGTVDKYVGDAILAVFGSPEPDPQHHVNAVRAAMGLQAAMRRVNAERTEHNLVTCNIGIGLHCGQVVHGVIGALERMQFTVIGDAVNRAARYCDGAPPGEVLISPEVYARVWTVIQAERTSIVTKHEGDMQAYRVERLKA